MAEHLGVKQVIDGRLIEGFVMDSSRGKILVEPHLLRVKKGTRYVIDMESRQFDAYLMLENPSRKIIRADDDSGGGFNARIDFVAEEDGDYRILATSFGGSDQGAYGLIV